MLPVVAPVPAAAADGLLQTLLHVSLTGVILFQPVFGGDPARPVDLAYVQLNPAAQRMLRLPEYPTDSFLALYPSAVNTGIFAFYRDTFAAGTAGRYDVNYQHDGLDNYYHLAAQRHGELLVVSFSDTADQPRTAVEQALRDSQAAEQLARAEAERQRQRFYEVLVQLPAHVAVYHGPDHIYQFVNPPYQRLFPHRSFAGRPFREGTPEAEGLGVVALFDRVYRTGEPFYGHEMEGDFDIHGTGEPEHQFFNLYLLPLRNAQGVVDGVLDFSYDVSEQVLARRQVEQLNQELETRVQVRTREALALQADLLVTAQRRVREREEFYQVFEQTAAVVGLLRTPGHRFEYVNPAFRAIFPGRPLAGRTLAEAAPDMVEQGFGALLDRVFRTGETYFGTELPFAAAVPEGQAPRPAYYNFTYQAYREANEIVGVSIFAYDVTEQVLARQEREAQQGELHRVFEQAPVPITVLRGPDLVVESANAAISALWGRPAAETVGKPYFEAVPATAGQGFEQILADVLRTGQPFFITEMPVALARAHTGQPPVGNFNFVFQALFGPSGTGVPVGIVAVGTEVTEQVAARQQVHALNAELTVANKELQQSNHQLQRTNVDLDNFIYTASHDLKAPITNIEGLLDTLRHELPEQPPTGEVAHILALMQGAVERFQRTIEHLTAVSKLQKEHDPPTAQVALAPVLDGVRLDLAPLLRQTGGRLHLDVAACPPLRFEEKNLRSVLYNLLGNALKYRHPDRVPEVHVRCHQADDFTVLEVQDNGLGLDVAREKQVFAMFQRLHTHVEGSGLGLYMVKRMVENVGGKITVHSRVGEGTTFAVYFPH